MFKKTILSACVAIGLLIGSAGCSDFGDVNVDPEHLTGETMDYKYVFTNVQVYVFGTDWEVWRNSLIYCSSMIQHTASVNWSQGDKYFLNTEFSAAYWDRIYPNGIRDAVTLVNQWKDNDDYVAEYHMARILKVILFHRMTDLYGDVPYFEAGLGYTEAIGYPKYDTQQSIYLDMLNELKEAGEGLARLSSSSIGDHDLMYKGDVVKWRKLAYSLMVRLGMRLSKVDPSTAQTWVAAAVSGGVFESNEDSALITHEDGNPNDDSAEAHGKILSQADPNAWYLSETFVNYLKSNTDPRLIYLGTVVPDNAGNITVQSPDWSYGDTTYVNQIGMPNGYDNSSEPGRGISTAPNYPGNKDLYSTINRYTFARPDAPTFVVTHSATQLLLAEAAYRGWISGSAESYYNEGVSAAMKQFSQFPDVTGISEARIQQYLAENPYNASTALEDINMQYWVALFMDEYEAFANWRRSGYPQLTPVNYQGNVTGGVIPRRFVYPNDEAINNSDNYREAVSRLNGGDNLTSRVWWDAQ